MRRLFPAALIIGGSLWILFWTFHTIAHGPMNPAPTTGRFLGLSSMDHGMLMALSSGPFLAFGWLGLARSMPGRGFLLRWTGAAVGAGGIAAFFAAAFASFRFPASVWPLASGGMLALLIGAPHARRSAMDRVPRGGLLPGRVRDRLALDDVPDLRRRPWNVRRAGRVRPQHYGPMAYVPSYVVFRRHDVVVRHRLAEAAPAHRAAVSPPRVDAKKRPSVGGRFFGFASMLRRTRRSMRFENQVRFNEFGVVRVKNMGGALDPQQPFASLRFQPFIISL